MPKGDFINNEFSAEEEQQMRQPAPLPRPDPRRPNKELLQGATDEMGESDAKTDVTPFPAIHRLPASPNWKDTKPWRSEQEPEA